MHIDFINIDNRRDVIISENLVNVYNIHDVIYIFIRIYISIYLVTKCKYCFHIHIYNIYSILVCMFLYYDITRTYRIM